MNMSTSFAWFLIPPSSYLLIKSIHVCRYLSIYISRIWFLFISVWITEFQCIYIYIYIYIRCVMVIAWGNGSSDPSSIFGRGCLLGKIRIQLLYFLLSVNSRTNLFSITLIWQMVEKINFEFKPIKLRLKLTLCHILPTQRGWYIYLYNIYIYIYK